MFLLIFTSLLLAKINSHLLGFQILNPDETQMMSNAIGIFNKGNAFLKFDGTTSGILNSLILGWPEIFNLDITFLSTRITAIILLAIIILCVLKIIYFQIQKIYHTLILIAPLWIFFLFTKDPDFLHYSTELLSTTFLTLSYLLIKLDKNFSKKNTIIIAPILLGLVFFSKIQFFPVAIIIFLIILIELFLQKKDLRKYFISVFFFLLPSFIIFTLLFVSGNLKDFFINNFIFAYDFISFSQSKNILFEVYSEKKINTPISVGEGFKKHLTLNLVFHIIYFYFFISLLLLFKAIKIGFKSIIFNKDIIFISLIILSLVAVILIPGKMHRHYLIALVPFLPIFISQLMCLIISDFKKETRFSFLSFFSIGFLILTMISAFLEKDKFYSKKFDRILFKKQNIHLSSPRIFQYLFDEDKQTKLYIWGWMPKWYILSYMTPSSRETISEKQIIKNINRDYYRNRLLNDLNENKPDLIIDFVKEKSFRYDKPSQNIESFKKLNEFTNRNYKKLSKLNINCPDYFLDNQNYNFFISKNIPYKISKNNDAYLKLKDLSVTEDICDDSVYFSKLDDDLIDFDLENPSFISKLMFLGSKRNIDRLDLKIILHFENSKTREKFIKLNLFPYWTSLNIDNKEKIIKVQIDIQELKIKNAGLNEVIFYK